ncbi:glycosyltransferase family 39 protein [Ornithinimicrobium tianjinense]|uniref:Glycosyltransferase RgtA/B/C/D-like domain-containing protein n=1 Tax=Ornithinimicrobium tianjinense TaxID=1195761 RepID=A0A917BGC3_9MICO|nr:glycosyltransferase family 39 protein [Ornithinimicrobium tianjinense]GGF43383.1 hypothetical protein GCM10011366_09010 [Ornithinimicrobium tianjinense]
MTRRPPRPAWWGLGAAVLVGVALAGLGGWLTFHRLGVSGAASDEIVYVTSAQAYLRGDFSANAEHPPLGKWIIALGLRPGLEGQELLGAARLPVAVLGWLTGLVLTATAWLLTRRVVPALAAGGLWWLLPGAAGSPHDLVRVAMLDGPMMFFVAVSLLMSVLAWRTRQLRWWPLAAAAAGLAAATKLPGGVALLGLAPVVLLALVRPAPGAARSKVVLTVLGCGLVMGLTFLATYLPAGSGAVAWARETFAFQLDHAADGHPVEIAGRVVTDSPWWAAWWWQARYLRWPGVVVLWGLAVVGLLRWGHRGAWVLGAPLLAGSLALAVSPLQLPHYHLVLTPMLVVAAGAALAAPGPRADRQRPRGASVVVSAVASLALLVLVPIVVQHGAAVARTTGSPFAAAEEELRERGLEDVTLTVWADPFAAKWYLPDHPRTARSPAPDGVAIVNESYARRRGFPLEEWCAAECGRRERVDLGGLALYLPVHGIP